MENPKSNGYRKSEPALADMRHSATEVSQSAEHIAGIANLLNEGVGTQENSLETALSAANEIAASLKESANQSESLASSSEQLASSTAEVAASLTQVSGNTSQAASAVSQTATSIKQMGASIQSISGAGQEM